MRCRRPRTLVRRSTSRSERRLEVVRIRIQVMEGLFFAQSQIIIIGGAPPHHLCRCKISCCLSSFFEAKIFACGSGVSGLGGACVTIVAGLRLRLGPLLR